MTCEDVQAIADSIRERCGVPRVRITIENGAGNTLTVESAADDDPPSPIGERIENFEQAPWAR